MRPVLFRPPLFVSGRTSDFSGVVRVISTKSATEAPRRPGVVGLYLRIAMSVTSQARSGDRTSENVDAGAPGQADDRALGVLAPADPGPGTTRLALAVDRVHRRDLHAENLL